MKSGLRLWARLRSLSGAQWMMLTHALVLLPSLSLALRFLGYGKTVRLVQARAPGASDEPVSAEQLHEFKSMSRMIAVASNHGIHRGNCLTKSLTLLWLMKRSGRAGRLVLGARRDDGRFDAHAWVECGGIVINDDAGIGKRYIAFGNAAAWLSTSGARRAGMKSNRGCAPRHGEVYE